MGKLIVDTLLADAGAAARITEIRGRGLMLGIQLDHDCTDLAQRALDAGLLINVTAGNTIRLLPPLIITEQEALAIASGMAALIGAAA